MRVVFPVNWLRGSVCEADVDLGETLEILGMRQPDGTVSPTDAMFRFPIAGRVTSASVDGTSLTVMGRAGGLEPGAQGAGQRRAILTAIRAGDYVQVSGLLRDGAIVASRIERMGGPVRSSVMGRVEAGDLPGTVRINGVAVRYGASVPPQIGWTVRVTGSEEGGALVPYDTQRSLLETVPAPVSDVSIEGYLERRATATGYGIAGFGREFDAGSKVNLLARERALFIGSLEQGEFRARHGLRLPSDAEARRIRVEAVRNGYAPAGAVETR